MKTNDVAPVGSSDQWLEARIQEFGDQMLAAHAAGDRDTARYWMERQNAAIGRRSAAMVARMEERFFSDPLKAPSKPLPSPIEAEKEAAYA